MWVTPAYQEDLLVAEEVTVQDREIVAMVETGRALMALCLKN